MRAYSRIVISIEAGAGARLASTASASAVLALILTSSANSAAIYKCTGPDGSITYGDTPCGSDAKPPQAVTAPQVLTAPPAPSASLPPTSTTLSPEMVAAAKLAELVKSGSIGQLQTYLSSPGVNINDRPGTDEALLDYAADQNQAQIAQYLLEHGARVDAVQTQGRNAGFTALHRAAIVDAADVTEILLAHGAEVNVHGPLGVTPLILAAANGSRHTAEVLLNHGADISTPTGHRETALSEATAHGHDDIVKLLLNHVPPSPSPAIQAGPSHQNPGMPCAITPYIQWARAQSKPPDPDVKARKLQEIDAMCGTSLHLANVQSGYEAILNTTHTPTPPTAPSVTPAPVAAFNAAVASAPPTPTASTTGDEFPAVPEKHLPALKAIPRQGDIVLEVGDSYGRYDTTPMSFRSDISIFDLGARKEYRWDLPKALLDGLSPQSSIHRASWSPKTSNLLFAKLNEAFLISRDGEIHALSLQMPGHLKPFDGIETYSMSPDGQFIAFYVYTRDVGQRQSDGFGKLYVDLMFEKTAGSPPVTIMRKTRPAALAWSPDGQEIAYGTYEGRVVVLDHTGKQLLSVQAGTPPGQTGFGGDFIWDLKWQPDGRQLGVLVYPTRRLLLMDDQGVLKDVEIKSTGLFKKKVTVNSFAWSPDGRRVAFRSAFEAAENCNHLALGYKFETGNFPCLNGSNLYVSNSDGTGLARITPKTDYAYASQGELFWVQ